ncbi:hypothetical protein SLA2020_113530 [Shorea laevis]
MDSSSTSPELAVDASPMLRLYKDGRIERLMGTEVVPPGFDPKTNVDSKDVLYLPENGLSNRLYVPKTTNPGDKLPLLIYFHGGAFCLETAFSPTYHNYLNPLVAEANIIAVSVDYRRAPEHPIPAAYDDAWTALKWVASHSGGNGPANWLNSHADFGKVFFAGDSAGANIAHHMAMRIGKEKLEGFAVTGINLTHPYFWGTEPVGDEIKDLAANEKIEGLWRFASPGTSGCDDPWMNPLKGPDLAGLGCSRVLVCVAEKDILKHRGCYYYAKLKESGWGGEIEIMESEGENHVFHLFNPTCENAVAMLKKVASFLNQDKA